MPSFTLTSLTLALFGADLPNMKRKELQILHNKAMNLIILLVHLVFKINHKLIKTEYCNIGIFGHALTSILV